jgi:hypothetical protein
LTECHADRGRHDTGFLKQPPRRDVSGSVLSSLNGNLLDRPGKASTRRVIKLFGFGPLICDLVHSELVDDLYGLRKAFRIRYGVGEWKVQEPGSLGYPYFATTLC